MINLKKINKIKMIRIFFDLYYANNNFLRYIKSQKQKFIFLNNTINVSKKYKFLKYQIFEL